MESGFINLRENRCIHTLYWGGGGMCLLFLFLIFYFVLRVPVLTVLILFSSSGVSEMVVN